jgi:RNA polymerase sigma-70 factor (ECF subfamily)
LRSRATRSESELPETLPEAERIEDVAFAHIDAQHVRTALAELPGEQREPIELGFFDGVTHEEIARRSGIPLGTVKTRIRSGLRKLRTVLDRTVTA